VISEIASFGPCQTKTGLLKRL